MSQPDNHYACPMRVLWLPQIIYWNAGNDESKPSSSPIDSAGLRYALLDIAWYGHSPTGTSFVLNTLITDGVGTPQPVVPAAIQGDATLSGAVVTIATQSSGSVRVTWERMPRFIVPVFTAGSVNGAGGVQFSGCLYGTP